MSLTFDRLVFLSSVASSSLSTTVFFSLLSHSTAQALHITVFSIPSLELILHFDGKSNYFSSIAKLSESPLNWINSVCYCCLIRISNSTSVMGFLYRFMLPCLSCWVYKPHKRGSSGRVSHPPSLVPALQGLHWPGTLPLRCPNKSVHC